MSTLEFAKNETLTHTVTFVIGFVFSESPGSTFSESPGPGLGPLYRVYLGPKALPFHFGIRPQQQP